MNASTDSSVEQQALLDQALAAQIEIAIARSNEAVAEGKRTREVVDRTHEQVLVLRKMMGRIVSDHFEQRTGIPNSWNRRLIIVGIAAFVAAFVSGCMQFVFRH